VLTGVKGQEDCDGPEHFHVVLVDNGRSRLLGTEMQPMLRCIRCGACMNHCPVYQNVGGHAYGWVYPGPMGSVLTPLLAGLDQAIDLPNASTLCGQCAVVCPVKIPLPDLLRHLRGKDFTPARRQGAPVPPHARCLGLDRWPRPGGTCRRNLSRSVSQGTAPMSARENILAHVTAARREHAASGTMEVMRGQTRLPEGDLTACFIERATRLASDVATCAALANVPAAVATYLAAHKLPYQAICWPVFNSLAWQEAGIDVETRGASGDAQGRASAAEHRKPEAAADLVGITGAFCAIAETGTLMLLSGPETPASVSLLPETHIAVVDARNIVATMEDAWRRLRAEQGALPRAVNFISGPSRTADIEQTVTLGAHGPYRVHILLVGSGAA
jgi:L-lactate utilization protein LutC/ferredoxin